MLLKKYFFKDVIADQRWYKRLRPLVEREDWALATILDNFYNVPSALTYYQLHKKDQFVIVTDNQEDYGWGSLKYSSEHLYYLDIYVALKHRKKGIGLVIAKELLKKKSLPINVGVVSLPAQQFYKKVIQCFPKLKFIHRESGSLLKDLNEYPT